MQLAQAAHKQAHQLQAASWPSVHAQDRSKRGPGNGTHQGTPCAMAPSTAVEVRTITRAEHAGPRLKGMPCFST